MPPHEASSELRRSIRIATLSHRDPYNDLRPYHMGLTRWLRMSEALANLGYQVEVIVNTQRPLAHSNPNLRYVPYSQVDWRNYDIVKAVLHRGFESLQHEGGDAHPFIITKMGSVVGNNDTIEGVHFRGKEREGLYETQIHINRRSRYTTILTEPSKLLWEREFGKQSNILIVPTGVDREIPLRDKNPYKEFDEKVAVYIGTTYAETQKHVSLLWQCRLNGLGRVLKRKGIRLCVVGPGNTEHLDRKVVTHLGAVENDRIWDYHYFAHAGITLAQGDVQHNESSKIYYYLRTGLPVVSETPIPNNNLIEETRLGFVADYNDDQMMGEMIEAAVYGTWQREEATRHMLQHHTWDRRAQIYDTLIRREFGLG